MFDFQTFQKDKSAQSSSIAAEAVRYFDRIYHEESLLKDLSAEERYKERLAKIKPLLDEPFAWLKTVPVSGKSALAKAVRYALHEKPYFYTFLQDGNVPPDNNRAENEIRPFAIGRKNWLFSNTANGAKASAVLYSDYSVLRKASIRNKESGNPHQGKHQSETRKASIRTRTALANEIKSCS